MTDTAKYNLSHTIRAGHFADLVIFLLLVADSIVHRSEARPTLLSCSAINNVRLSCKGARHRYWQFKTEKEGSLDFNIFNSRN
jgi:hypothetical protein